MMERELTETDELDLEDEHQEPPDPEEEWWEQHRAWTQVDLNENTDGSVSGYVTTNDNEDRGYSGEYAEWRVSYPDVATALKHWGGGSHQGISCRVEVYLDGEKV